MLPLLIMAVPAHLPRCLVVLQAALLLGLRAARRPAGYWDSLEVLDAELDAFVAGTAAASSACEHQCL